MKQDIDIIPEERTILIDDEYTSDTYEFFPEKKQFNLRSRVKNDIHYNYLTFEYRISLSPIKIEWRLLEKSYESPTRHNEVKDGVVLKSEIIENAHEDKFLLHLADETMKSLDEQVKWTTIEIFGNYSVNLFILALHPEIIPPLELRKFLRESVERIKLGSAKAIELIKNDKVGLQITESDYGKNIWYKDKIEAPEDFYNLSEEERNKTEYGKKLNYVISLENDLFDPNSKNYVGIKRYEFNGGEKITKYIEDFLEPKPQKTEPIQTQKTSNKWQWIVVIVLTIIALSSGVWTAIGVFLLGAIILNLINKN